MRFLLPVVVLSLSILTLTAGEDAPVLKAGIIGLDTSHVVHFTEMLNNAKADSDLGGVKVIAAFPGGSDDIPESHSRVPEYTAKLKSFGVEMVDSVEALLAKVDVVFLESTDGRPHLKQALPVLKSKKPLFIDKPVAGTLADALEIFRVAKELDAPCFSSSALRYCTDIPKMRTDPRVGGVLGCAAFSPCATEPHHPDLFWYGIHGVEILFTIMGPGCVSVQRTTTKDTDHVTGVWKDGRIGTFRGLRSGTHGYGSTVFGTKGIVQSGGFDSYNSLVVEIVKFFKTKKAPVAAEDTLEIYAFMEAADESKRQNGAPVTIESVMAKAKQK